MVVMANISYYELQQLNNKWEQTHGQKTASTVRQHSRRFIETNSVKVDRIRSECQRRYGEDDSETGNRSYPCAEVRPG